MKLYRQVCEGNLSSYELAHEAAPPLIADVKEYGQGPIRILEKAANELKNVDTGPLFRGAVDWKDVQLRIQKIVRQTNGHKRGCEIAKMVCQEAVRDLQRPDQFSDLDCKELFKRYFQKILAVNFEGRIPESGHYNDVEHEEVLDRLESMKPHINEEIIEDLATQISQNDRVGGLRRPRHHVDPIGLHDNLLEQ